MTTRRKYSRKWPAVYVGRLRELRKRMSDNKLDAFLLTNPTDIFYLTGFSGEDSWALVNAGSVTALSDRRFEEELALKTPHLIAVMRKKSLTEELKKVSRKHRLRRIGFQSDYTTVKQRKEIAKGIGGKKLRDTADWMITLRKTKNDAEVRCIETAVRIQERAFRAMLREIKPGMTERQATAILEFNMKKLGADGTSFGTIVAAGANSSIPHYRAGDVKIKKGSPILFDFGARYRGYCSDMTRVIAFDRFPSKIEKIYRIVRDAYLAGIDAVRPGAHLKDVDAVARKVIEKAGYGKAFGHSLGHGIGLDIHEEPRLAKLSKGQLEPGNVVTIEPGIYLPGVGGVRIEDDILVTSKGHRNLCSLPTDLESAII